MNELIGSFVGFVLTMLVFSYLLGDNPLFRLAIHIFIGVAGGYAATVAWYSVLWPQLIYPILNGTSSERLFVLFPLVLGGLLLTKMSPRLAGLGGPPLAYLVGVGVATAIGGAVLGTVFPQSLATMNAFDLPAAGPGGDFWSRLLNAIFILVGTLTTLVSLHFGARPRPDQTAGRAGFIESLAWVGHIFIAITFGAIFAGVFTAALAALVERTNFLVLFLAPLFGAQ